MNHNHVIESWIAQLALSGRLAGRKLAVPAPGGS